MSINSIVSPMITWVLVLGMIANPKHRPCKLHNNSEFFFKFWLVRYIFRCTFATYGKSTTKLSKSCKFEMLTYCHKACSTRCHTLRPCMNQVHTCKNFHTCNRQLKHDYQFNLDVTLGIGFNIPTQSRSQGRKYIGRRGISL